MYKPFLNFLFAFLIPAACLYYFADSSLGKITALREANKALADSLVQGTGNTIVIHDTVLRDNRGKDKSPDWRDSLRRLTNTYEQKLEGRKDQIVELEQTVDSLRKTKGGTRVVHDTVYRSKSVYDTRTQTNLRDSINYLTGLIQDCRRDKNSKYGILVKQLRTCDSLLKLKNRPIGGIIPAPAILSGVKKVDTSRKKAVVVKKDKNVE